MAGLAKPTASSVACVMFLHTQQCPLFLMIAFLQCLLRLHHLEPLLPPLLPLLLLVLILLLQADLHGSEVAHGQCTEPGCLAAGTARLAGVGPAPAARQHLPDAPPLLLLLLLQLVPEPQQPAAPSHPGPGLGRAALPAPLSAALPLHQPPALPL